MKLSTLFVALLFLSKNVFAQKLADLKANKSRDERIISGLKASAHGLLTYSLAKNTLSNLRRVFAINLINEPINYDNAYLASDFLASNLILTIGLGYLSYFESKVALWHTLDALDLKSEQIRNWPSELILTYSKDRLNNLKLLKLFRKS